MKRTIPTIARGELESFRGLTFGLASGRDFRALPMIREIVQYGHPVLRQRCRPVEVVDETITELVADMLDTMVDANGVLFVDRLAAVAKVSMKNRLKRLLDQNGHA
jgi:peptide deformylase